MQITLTKAELKQFAAEELSRRMGETITIDDIKTSFADDLPLKPDVKVYNLMLFVKEFPGEWASNKIACIKELRQKANNMGIQLGLAQAKWMVESIRDNAWYRDIS